MENLIHADVFFFVTTVVVILLGLIIVVGGFYALRILQSVRYIVDKIKAESDNVSEDIAELRGQIKNGGAKFTTIFKTLAMFFVGKANAKRRRKSADQDDN